MNGLRIALLANLKSNAPHDAGEPEDRWYELDSERTVDAITSALQERGHQVTFLEGDTSLYQELERGDFDIAFNICEGHRGDARESQVPAILEMLGIPYTGSKVLCLALTLDKAMTKRILAFHGLPTPRFQVFEAAHQPVDSELRFPLFVKPSREGTGIGISARSVVRHGDELRRQVRWVLQTYQEPALVEEYIEGREITVGVLGNQQLYVLPPLEVDLSACPPEEEGIYTGRIKSEFPQLPCYVCPAPLTEAQVQQLSHLAVEAFRTVDCLDMARVDFKLAANDGERPYILEINPLPGLSPGVSDLVFEAEAVGMSHAQLINAILNEALKRYPQLAHRTSHEYLMQIPQASRGWIGAETRTMNGAGVGFALAPHNKMATRARTRR
ncbi:MAG: ATP-grasp domain-containing protein [Anaerolineae bacterium]|nr:ATP-grasp domain-containing protein [Anaerolineae bacterium]NIN94785.1 ATP-grasp domain-containing protein [Anaerolineae bacterium]NIQ77867.1 ATP-grasp domain-containing protein [Anaerolineae bacterium]